MALGSTQTLTEKNTSDIFWGVKAAGAYAWQIYHLHVQTVYKFWKPKPPGNLRACPGLYRDCFTTNIIYRASILEWLMDKCGRIRKLAVVFLTRYSLHIRLEGLKKILQHISRQATQRRCIGFNWVPPAYKPHGRTCSTLKWYLSL